MALTKVQTISNALTMLGKKPVTSLDTTDPLVNSAVQAYDFLLPACLAKNQWRFATNIEQLSQIANGTPIVKWQYSYALPGNFLKLICLYPQNYQFELYANNILYSNLNSPLYIEYVFQPADTELPGYFLEYFIYELATYLALSNAQSPQFAQFLEQKRGVQFAIACSIDAQNRPQTPLLSAPMLNDRAIGIGTVSG